MVRVPSGNKILMDYIEKVLEKLKEWTRKLVEALLGPQAEPEPEPEEEEEEEDMGFDLFD